MSYESQFAAASLFRKLLVSKERVKDLHKEIAAIESKILGMLDPIGEAPAVVEVQTEQGIVRYMITSSGSLEYQLVCVLGETTDGEEIEVPA